MTALESGLVELGLPDTFVNLVEDTTRQSATELMHAVGYVDLLIPSGRPPADPRLCGECHGALHPDRNRHLPRLCGCGSGWDMAVNIIEKRQGQPSLRLQCGGGLSGPPGHRSGLSACSRNSSPRSREQAGKPPVELRAIRVPLLIPGWTPAGEQGLIRSFWTIPAVRLVDSVEQVVEHIALHSPRHSEAIVTEDASAADQFIAGVDSAAVYVNASTRLHRRRRVRFGL